MTTQALSDVITERRRQIEGEGWSPEHDDEHADGEMAEAATVYAQENPPKYTPDGCPVRWPWPLDWYKPKDRRSNLVRAAALLLAEIERLDRITSKDKA